MISWLEPLSALKSATPAVRNAFRTLEIETIRDLLLTLPHRYDDYSQRRTIQELRSGEVVTVEGRIVSCEKKQTFRGRVQLIQARIADDTGTLRCDFFNQVWLLKEFTPGRLVRLSGKVEVDPLYGPHMRSPLWEPGEGEAIAAGKVAPVYALTEALAQKTYRRVILQALQTAVPEEEPAIQALMERNSFPSLLKALHAVHEPTVLAEAEKGRERLAFEELIVHRLAYEQVKREEVVHPSITIPFDEVFAKRFVKQLPFSLTDDQKRAVWVSIKEMENERPMRRLLQGDVGSGKTVVAAFLAAHIQRAGYSAVLLAPTDILARQHAATFRKMLNGLHVSCLCLTRTERTIYLDTTEEVLKPPQVHERIAKGNIVIVGTHAMLYQERLPQDLALAIVDEQHRFGVSQREQLTATRGARQHSPHFLSMTATPIPRSLALTIYGDLEVSVLKQKPAGRLPIKTYVRVGDGRRDAYQAIREAVKRGEQAFVVCPLVDPSDTLGVRSVTEEKVRLEQGPLFGLRIGLVHGRLKPAEKEEAMRAFSARELDVLVATAVIEVGVDVPNATVMVIEGAERFGLAQLHQFRGRVGRSAKPSVCYLLSDAQFSLARLELMERIDDGFVLAEEDLKMRGTGQLMGTEQSGHSMFHTVRDTDLRLMSLAAQEAARYLNEDPTLEHAKQWKEEIEALQKTSHME
ncbi:ATP-dependent DNA helicase RecG [Patescibacteria group bacterium]|nr:ATP-dependent DNA helicase RecG [Patescibacteria group bacterium]